MYDAVFQWLAHDFQYGTGKFRQFIEKKDAVMGQRHFSRPRNRAASDKAVDGNRMMRTAERPLGNHAVLMKQSGYGVNFRYLQ